MGVQLLTSGDYGRIPFGAPRGLYDAQHLFMPRFSFSSSLDSATVIRGGPACSTTSRKATSSSRS